MMKTLLLLCVLALVSGCAGLGVQGLSEAQIRASANIKDVNALCFQTIGLWGSVTTNFLSVDQKVLPKDGRVGLTKDCEITLQQSSPPPKGTP